jgi:hypothetical protein
VRRSGSLLRLIDSHTGRYVELPPGARRVLRVYVHPPHLDHDDGLVRLRVLLVADVLRRVAELHGTQVLAALRHPAILDAPEA